MKIFKCCMNISINIMNKYILVQWPEIQKFMDYPEWDKCYCGYSETDEFSNPSSCYFVPEDFYKEVMYKLQFPKKYENTNLGTIVLYETRAIVNGTDTYWYNESNIKRGNIALIHDKNGNWYTSKIIACSRRLPIIVEDSEFVIGINCELIGHRDPEIPF